MIEVPGDMLEGGGQVVRVAVALSAVTGKPVHVVNVRAKRSPPGLRPQHLTAVKAVAELASAEVEGLEVGSREVTFTPGIPHMGRFRFDIGTAGSTSLVIQSLLPLMAYSLGRVNVELVGGTNNPMAPPIDYIKHALKPALNSMGLGYDVNLVRRGFYPKGGGIVKTWVDPVKALKPINLTAFGEVQEVYGFAYSARLPSHIVKRMAGSAERILNEGGYPRVEIELENLSPGDAGCALSPGCGIILFARLSSGWVLGWDALGELGKPAEKVGEEAALGLMGQLETRLPVDRHLADQLIPWIALAKGASKLAVTELSLHTLTCIEVSKRIVGAGFSVKDGLGKRATIECDGVGLENRFIR